MWQPQAVMLMTQHAFHLPPVCAFSPQSGSEGSEHSGFIFFYQARFLRPKDMMHHSTTLEGAACEHWNAEKAVD